VGLGFMLGGGHRRTPLRPGEVDAPEGFCDVGCVCSLARGWCPWAGLVEAGHATQQPIVVTGTAGDGCALGDHQGRGPVKVTVVGETELEGAD
jgi:hypothetical protein